MCLLAVLGNVLAQAGDGFFSRYNFHYLTERDGLPSGMVNDIIRDSDGFVWIATPGGVCRYDSYQVDVYNSQTASLTLRNNYVNALCEDGFHRLWMGTAGGLEVVDLDTYRTVDVWAQADEALRGLASGLIHSLYRDKG